MTTFVFQSNVADDGLEQKLRVWGIKFGVTRVAISALLVLLLPFLHPVHQSTLPRDARTLYRGLKQINVERISNQKCYSFDFRYIFTKFASEYKQKFQSMPDIMYFSLNLDGVSPFKNSINGFWSLLLKIHNLKFPVVFPLTLSYGKSKPSDLQFLSSSIDCIASLVEVGVDNFTFILKCVVCDLPAKSFALNCFQFNHNEHPCDRCTIKGFHRDHRTLINVGIGEFRTNEDFRNNVASNQKGQLSIFTRITTLDMVTDFVFDGMHTVYLGCAKKLFMNVVKECDAALLKKIDDHIHIFNQ